MVKSSTLLVIKNEKLYSDTLYQSQSMVKKLKTQHFDDACFNEHNLENHTKDIIEYMGLSGMYKEKNYSRSMILLDNILVLRKDLLYEINIPESFVVNLHKYYLSILKLYDPDQNNEQIQALLYACHYLILLLVYNAGLNAQKNITLRNKMFTKQFLDSFTKLSPQNCNNKMKRVVSLILAYIAKNKPEFLTYPKIKNLILELIYTCDELIARSHLALALKKVSKFVTSTEIKKYNVIDFLFECLKLQDSQSVKNSLFMLSFILSNFKQHTSKIISMQLMKYWDVQVKQYPQICLNIFKMILPFISNEKKQNWFIKYMNHIIKCPHNTSHIHVLIMESLIPWISMKLYLQLFENSDILKIEQLGKRNDQKINEAFKKFKERLNDRFRSLNPNMLCIYGNYLQGSLDNSLSDLY